MQSATILYITDPPLLEIMQGLVSSSLY